MSKHITAKIRAIKCRCGGTIMMVAIFGLLHGVCRRCLMATEGYEKQSDMSAAWAAKAPAGDLASLSLSGQQLSMLMLAAVWKKSLGDKVRLEWPTTSFSGEFTLASEAFTLIDTRLFVRLSKLPGGLAPLRRCF